MQGAVGRAPSQECGASARLEALGRGVGASEVRRPQLEDPRDSSEDGRPEQNQRRRLLKAYLLAKVPLLQIRSRLDYLWMLFEMD